MIVSTKDDIVRLSGSLVKNQWLTIKAAANLLLRTHPEGIIIDCQELDNVSADGAKTFLDAMRDIQAGGARIVVCNLPEDVLRVIRSVPGVRSQLPIANSVEEARASLRLGEPGGATLAERAGREHGLVVPLLPGLDVDYALIMAGRLARELKAAIHMVYLLEVSRNLPLSSPLGAEETTANSILREGTAAARRHGLQATAHIERVREAEEGLLHVLRTYKADFVVLGAFADRANDERFHDMVDVLLRRAPCSVLIGRKAPDPNDPHAGELPGGIEDEF